MDGEVAARVRALVGPDVPIGMAPDMHANLSQQDDRQRRRSTVVYRTNPHLDPRPRARECAELIVRTIRGEIRPVQALEMPPVVDQHRQAVHRRGADARASCTMSRRCSRGRACCRRASPRAIRTPTSAEMGMAFWPSPTAIEAAAREAARWLARRAWERRAEFVGDTPSADEALQRRDARAQGPGRADGRRRQHRRRQSGPTRRSCWRSRAAPRRAAAICRRCAIRRPSSLRRGRRRRDASRLPSAARPTTAHGRPVAVSGTRAAAFRMASSRSPRPTHGGFRFFDGGTTVVLETDRRAHARADHAPDRQHQHPADVLGRRPAGGMRRSSSPRASSSPRPAYEPIAAEIVLVNTPGVTTSDLSRFTYTRRRRPLYPFEPEATY